jgi:hypothetical protein
MTQSRSPAVLGTEQKEWVIQSICLDAQQKRIRQSRNNRIPAVLDRAEHIVNAKVDGLALGASVGVREVIVELQGRRSFFVLACSRSGPRRLNPDKALHIHCNCRN